ncbi:hypothetical protein [Methanosarcina mazei]|jgi:hypothetical protein|uniref:Uncharacterized protein n=1 Tax=Methanosarcina mazei Tuc01 TaxID=1236903 RepID=M1QMA9_METMZ|nr:hypothetical protein [Methanosarcina mazei]AGF98179.1 hypothetical protein MmTuc01_2905 [Methanosarcina mazei Tuc01]WIM42774.1 hypothetical protein PSF70_14965 [Methanosarcina mazei]
MRSISGSGKKDAKTTGRMIGLRTSPFETRSEKMIKETNTPAIMKDPQDH